MFQLFNADCLEKMKELAAKQRPKILAEYDNVFNLFQQIVDLFQQNRWGDYPTIQKLLIKARASFGRIKEVAGKNRSDILAALNRDTVNNPHGSNWRRNEIICHTKVHYIKKMFSI